MAGKFVITKTPKGYFRFSLLSANHQTVLTSKNYANLRTCREGINTIKKNALSPISDLTVKEPPVQKNPKYEIYLDSAEQYRYRLVAVNGLTIAMTEDGYASKANCISGIDAVGRAAVDSDIDESALQS